MKCTKKPRDNFICRPCLLYTSTPYVDFFIQLNTQVFYTSLVLIISDLTCFTQHVWMDLVSIERTTFIFSITKGRLWSSSQVYNLVESLLCILSNNHHSNVACLVDGVGIFQHFHVEDSVVGDIQ